jgi:UDP-2,3-diacylglucosamine hydrolase
MAHAPGGQARGAKRVLLVSDLHLSEERPATNERLFRFLDEEARGVRSLYVLGDLFESWIGDDALDAPDGSLGKRVANALSALTRNGTRVYLMHGNRDFLMGERLCLAAGATLLEDPAVVEIGGEPALLMHGDTLCTDDLEYQAWRATARSAAWQRDFLSRPVSERIRIASSLRETSREKTRAKPPQIMDVNQDAVQGILRRAGVRRLIHGHTHRPALHELRVDGRRCERWVLPDWYGTGGYLEADDSALRLVFFGDAAGGDPRG